MTTYNFCSPCPHPTPTPGSKICTCTAVTCLLCLLPGLRSHLYPLTPFHVTPIERTHKRSPEAYRIPSPSVSCRSLCAPLARHSRPRPPAALSRVPFAEGPGICAGCPPFPAAPRRCRAGWLTWTGRRDRWRPRAASKRHAELADPGLARGVVPPTRKNSPNFEAAAATT